MTKRFFLRQPSEAATVADAQIACDLADTLKAHCGRCVGMAANMIGERKRIIAVVDEDGSTLVMMNPDIVRKSGPYVASEGCLSLPGEREAQRFESITVAYADVLMRGCERSFAGRVAQAIQHEVDHCDGVLI